MDKGIYGECLASKHLRRQGFRILKKNHTSRSGEIDLILQRQGLLVFCEVKTRTNDKFGEPYEAVNAFKQKRLKRLAESYLASHQINYETARFDVVSVLLSDHQGVKIEHIENAF